MRKIGCAVLLTLVLAWALQLSVHAQPSSPRPIFNQYLSDLQKNQDDYALREAIIKLVQPMKPAPAIPEEAIRHYVMGKTLLEDAKNIQDFKDAIGKFRKALLIAPWWPDANRDLGFALQAAQEYGEAIKALRLYIATNPGEENKRKAQNEIYRIEAKQEKAAKEKPVTEIKTKVEEKKKGLRDLEGDWYRKGPYDRALYPYDDYYHYRCEMRGEELFFIEVVDQPYWGARKGDEKIFFIAERLAGRNLLGTFPGQTGTGNRGELTIGQDFNEWELGFATPYTSGRKKYTRR